MLFILPIVIFMVCGVLVIKHGYPFHLAGVVVALLALLSLVNWIGILPLLISSAIFYGYTAFVFYMVDRYADEVFLSTMILIGGAIILILQNFIF